MKRNVFFVLFILIAIAFSNCKEDELKAIESDKSAPGTIANPVVESQAGAVKIAYSLPTDKDLLYVVAEYTNKYGKLIQSKASSYTSTLIVNGFADTSVYNVNLYAVDRSENRSAPVVVQVKPLEPPILGIYKNMRLAEDFGGINIQFDNPTEAEVAVVICFKDSTGNMNLKETYYTKQKNVNFASRGFESKETVFGVYIRDRWSNRTDTLKKALTPIYEKLLDRTKFRTVSLPTDAPTGWGLSMPGMWDGKITAEGNMWHSADVGMPMHITFDLGVTAKLSRFTLWQRQGVWIYNHGNPKRYEIWGSTNPPSNGSWDNWVMLKSCISVKPSGSPSGSNMNEDVQAAARGEEFTVPLDAPKVRYIRVRILEAWVGAGGLAAHISEMNFHGNDQ